MLLGKFGRKSLILVTLAICAVGIFGMWFFITITPSDTMLYTLTIIYILGFQFGPGPIVWLYLSEVCNNTATSFNTVVAWVWTLIMSIITLPLYTATGGWMFFIFGCTCTMGLIYCSIFMKETMNVSKEDQKTLYHKGGHYGALEAHSDGD